MPRTSRTPAPALFAVASLALTLALSLTPGTAPARSRHAHHRHAHPMPTVAGMVVARDPQTGALGVPSRDQVLELSARERNMLSRSTVGLTQHALAGGGVAMELGDRFQEFMTISVGPGGRKTYRCLDNVSDVKQAIQPAAPASRSLEEK